MRITKWGEYGILVCRELGRAQELKPSKFTTGTPANQGNPDSKAALSKSSVTDGAPSNIDETEATLACVGANVLADSLQIPYQYMQQILQRLRKGNVVSSTRGPGGGYSLARPAAQITLREILLAAEGATFEIICENNTIFENCSEGDHTCGLKEVWHELQGQIDTLLESYTLASLCQRQDFLDKQPPKLTPLPTAKRENPLPQNSDRTRSDRHPL